MSEMSQESLSERLMTICSMIDPCDTVVDVGSDHGKLSSYCLAHHICLHVIATDIHEQPAERARIHLAEQGFEDVSTVCCTDGLQGVKLVTGMTIVIAGMGGLEIRKILSNALLGEGMPIGMRLILQPQRSHYELRAFLSESGFTIDEESIAIEKGHYYTIMKVTYLAKKYELNDEQLFLGPCILRDRPPLFETFMEHERKVMQKKALGDPRCARIVERWETLL